MKTLEDDIKNIKEHISYKEKRRQAAEDIKNYRVCDDITEEIGSLSKESRQLAAELKLLAKKDKHSKLYYKRKSSSSKSPQSSSRGETCSPYPGSDSDTSGKMVTLSRDASRNAVTLSDCSTGDESDSNL